MAKHRSEETLLAQLERLSGRYKTVMAELATLREKKRAPRQK